MRPTVTVVVPVYNVAAYLTEAVNSVLAQTWPDWEMILVDDGSTDISGQMCDALAAQDARIRVIHKANGGLASARNAGLDQARGEWIMFLDGDDVWEKKMLETMLRGAQDTDVVCCGLQYFPEEGTDAWVEREVRFDRLTDMAEQTEFYFSRNCINSACTKLYRRQSILCRFDDMLRHAEDRIFNLEYLPQAQGIRFIPEKLYRYRYMNESTLSKHFWLDLPAISTRAWHMTRKAFADVPAALTFFDKRYVYEISKQLVTLARLEVMPEQQRLLVMQMYLQEPLLKDPCFLHAQKTPSAARLWDLISQGDAQSVFELCRAEGAELLGFVWAGK